LRDVGEVVLAFGTIQEGDHLKNDNGTRSSGLTR
jgi:hypothetical protein